MNIREAAPEDGRTLQGLQAKAPQGKSLVVSTVNVPDFFSRARAYETHKVFVASAEDQLIGSAACAVRDAVIRGRVLRIGYEFQYFTSPHHRRQGAARHLRQTIESYLFDQGAALSYALIMEGNVPSMRLFEREGFYLHRQLTMPALVPTKQVEVPPSGRIRPMTPHDLPSVAKLVSKTWQKHELVEPISPASLANQIERIPTLDYTDVLILEDQGEVLACVALWDWSQIMRITVLQLSLRMRVLGRLLVLARILPRFLKPGDTLRQMMLTMIAYKRSDHLKPLVRQVNNLALTEGFEQVFCICEKRDPILKSMRGFTRVDTRINLYLKPLQPDMAVGDGPVAMTGFDM